MNNKNFWEPNAAPGSHLSPIRLERLVEGVKLTELAAAMSISASRLCEAEKYGRPLSPELEARRVEALRRLAGGAR